jgi:hypothetical protein
LVGCDLLHQISSTASDGLLPNNGTSIRTSHQSKPTSFTDLHACGSLLTNAYQLLLQQEQYNKQQQQQLLGQLEHHKLLCATLSLQAQQHKFSTASLLSIPPPRLEVSPGGPSGALALFGGHACPQDGQKLVFPQGLSSLESLASLPSTSAHTAAEILGISSITTGCAGPKTPDLNKNSFLTMSIQKSEEVLRNEKL